MGYLPGFAERRRIVCDVPSWETRRQLAEYDRRRHLVLDQELPDGHRDGPTAEARRGGTSTTRSDHCAGAAGAGGASSPSRRLTALASDVVEQGALRGPVPESTSGRTGDHGDRVGARARAEEPRRLLGRPEAQAPAAALRSRKSRRAASSGRGGIVGPASVEESTPRGRAQHRAASPPGCRLWIPHSGFDHAGALASLSQRRSWKERTHPSRASASSRSAARAREDARQSSRLCLAGGRCRREEARHLRCALLALQRSGSRAVRSKRADVLKRTRRVEPRARWSPGPARASAGVTAPRSAAACRPPRCRDAKSGRRRCRPGRTPSSRRGADRPRRGRMRW